LLRAQQLEHEFTEESLLAALRCLEQALAIDPNYASAMALAGYCHAERRHQGWAQDYDVTVPEGLRLASRAVELGVNDGNVLWMAAFAVWRLEMDAQHAREIVNRSLLLNPNSAMASATAAWMEMFCGNPAKALELFRRAQRLSPRDPRGWFMAAGIAFVHFLENRFTEAASWTQKALIQNPRFGSPLRVRAAALAKLGQREKAAEVIREVLKIEPQLTLSKLRGRTTFLEESAWTKYEEALRLAGLPE
jgi:tetratricopeptide (TPR) repeat protein